LADTGSLPDGKLQQVRDQCARTAKPFEYAFLLDALKDERSQGITIDTARSFFKTDKRDYIIIDAPGHIEFLKNMVTGAARAEAALLVIDAQEGVQENSRRHGYLMAMLGVNQVAIVVNKMDLVGYAEKTFLDIKEEYTKFLEQVKVKPLQFIPISAFNGDNLVSTSEKMPWYQGPPVLAQLDNFQKSPTLEKLPFRMPVQDIYKFTEAGDDRRIIAGTIESGTVAVGDEIVFLPSQKKTRIKTLEAFNTETQTTALVGEAVGFTMDTQIYIKPGELVAKTSEQLPSVSSIFRANIFWVGRAPMIKNKVYKLKLAAARTTLKLLEVKSVLDASDLSSDQKKQQIDRHDVAECIFETGKPIAFDLTGTLEKTSRFVIVDNYEIAGGGIVVEGISTEAQTVQRHIKERERIWERGLVTQNDRAYLNKHKAKFIVITGQVGVGKRELAQHLEKHLFEHGFKAYYLGMANLKSGLDSDMLQSVESNEEQVRRLGELARIMTEAGLIFITTIDDADDPDIEKLALLNAPQEIMVVNVGDNDLSREQVTTIARERPITENMETIYQLLKDKEVINDYSI
ncbi:MAG: GTP-binding protein, partial [Candidatus Margulisiibacteriota bacterium]